MRLAALAVLVLVLALAACGTVHGHAQPQSARILPAPVPNAVPFTGPLPTYSPAAGRG